MLRCENISKSYWDRSGGTFRRVLDSCTLSIGEGEALGLMGPSGCGKSTLARILLRLIPADSGRVFFDGTDITNAPGRRLKPFRKKVQLVSQRPESFFDPLKTLGDSLTEPLRVFRLPRNPDAVDEILEFVKLSASLLARYPHQVSGGEIQRLAIARALLLRPGLLILDEPTSMLDISVQAQILHLLRQVRETRHVGYLLISHDRDVVRWMCDSCLYMNEGVLSGQARFARAGIAAGRRS